MLCSLDIPYFAQCLSLATLLTSKSPLKHDIKSNLFLRKKLDLQKNFVLSFYYTSGCLSWLCIYFPGVSDLEYARKKQATLHNFPLNRFSLRIILRPIRAGLTRPISSIK